MKALSEKVIRDVIISELNAALYCVNTRRYIAVHKILAN